VEGYQGYEGEEQEEGLVLLNWGFLCCFIKVSIRLVFGVFVETALGGFSFTKDRCLLRYSVGAECKITLS